MKKKLCMVGLFLARRNVAAMELTINENFKIFENSSTVKTRVLLFLKSGKIGSYVLDYLLARNLG